MNEAPSIAKPAPASAGTAMHARAPRLPVGLAAHGFSYLCGFAGAGTDRACPTPFDVYALMDLACRHGLSGVEFPVPWALAGEGAHAAALARARAYAEERELFIVVDAGVVDEGELHTLLPAAAALGAGTVRVMASTILCGDRRAVREQWSTYLAQIAQRLRSVRGLAEELGVDIAIENHQDLTSEELVALCEQAGSARIGVNLDAINPLAVVEDPLAFARRVAPYIKNVHLKDYYLYRTAEGFRLVRCAIGDGVLDVPGLFALLRAAAPGATVTIELGALHARHVRFLDDEFWPGYPPRRIEEVLPVLRLREERARPADEDWQTPWERGAGGEELAAYELGQCEQSVAFLRAER
jgi:sugar phosphate isomerase/epimerase